MKKLPGFSSIFMFAGALFSLLVSTGASAGKPLSFEQRVNAQEAIERVCYGHRIWPKENPQPKPPFEKMVPREQIEAKVTDYLKKSAALDDLWRRPITGDQLQAEMDRMARETLQPDVLQEIFSALDNDPHLIAECLARPSVAEGALRKAYESEGHLQEKFEEWWEGERNSQGTVLSEPPPSYSPPAVNAASCQHGANGTWYPTGEGTPSPEARAEHVAVWTGVEMIIWGGEGTGGYCLFNGGMFYPATNTWILTTDTNAPSPRYQHTAVWTGTEMIVWGGRNGVTHYNSGGKFNPVSNIWIDTATNGSPSGRFNHSAVWTGTDMIVWGGYDTGYCNTGGIYNPGDDSWKETPTADAPSVRNMHTAVWTGTEMIVWGGWDGTSLNTGGRYSPVDDLWVATSTASAPSARYLHTAVWTETEMIIWGGNSNTGGRYNTATNTWTPTSTVGAPTSRGDHTAVWTGSEMIAWGGSAGLTSFNSGGRYDPISDKWIATTTSFAPTTRTRHSAVWMGSGTEMIVWGGSYYSGSTYYLKSGGRYCASCSMPIFGGVDSVADPNGCSTGDGIVINWSAPSAWGTGSTTGTYNVLRYSSAGCGSTGTTLVSGLSASTLTYTDSTAVPNTTYYYQVVASNDCLVSSTGTASCSGAVSDIGGSLPSGLPSVIAADVDACADTGVEVSWPQNPGSWGDSGTGTRTYDVLRDDVEIATGIAYGTTEYTDTTGTNGTDYTYTVRYNNGCSLSSVTNEVGTWAETTHFLNGRSDHSSVAYNGYLYVIGGYRGGMTFSEDVQFAPIGADGSVGAWSTTTILPTARYGHASVVSNGYLYVIGGYDASWGYLNEVRYAPIHADGTLGAWTSTTSFTTGRRNHAAVVNNGFLYVIGGETQPAGRLADVQYAPINADGSVGSWTATTGLPTARYAHSSVANNGFLYVIGGNDVPTGFLDEVLYAPINGDGSIGTWSATTSLPAVNMEHASVTHKGYLYVIGGWTSFGFSDEVQLAHFNSDGTLGPWSATSSLPAARYQHTSAVYEGYMYVAGGGQMDNVYFARINSKGADVADDISVPTGLPAISAADLDACAETGVLISWPQDPADWGDGGSGTRSYDVLRDGAPIATGIAYGTTTYTDTGGTNNTVYSYAVRYENGCSVYADTGGANGSDRTGVLPSGLPAVTATDIAACSLTGIEITWGQDPADWGDSGSGIRTYDVLRGGAPISSGIAYGTTAYTDTSGSVATAYLYSVRYNNGCLLSAATAGTSAIDNGFAPAGIPAITAADTDGCSDSDVFITWAADPAKWGDGGSGARSYDVLRDGVPIATGLTYGTTFYSDATGVAGTSYYYSVRYTNGCGLVSDIGSWTETSAFPTPRLGHASVAYDGYLYIIGGYNGTYLDDVRFAPINADGGVGAWSAAASLTTGRSYHTSVAYNGYLYVIGGINSGGPLDDVQYAQINPDGTLGSWSTTTGLAVARYSHASVANNGYLYVIAGAGADYYDDVLYAPINPDGTIGTWATTTTFPTDRHSHSAAAYNGYLYVTGGYYSGDRNDVQFAPIYGDGTIGIWTATASFNTARYNHTSLVYNGYIFAIGGTNSSSAYFDDVQLARLNSDGTITSWMTSMSFPIARSCPRSVAYDGYLYVAGGYGETNQNLSDVRYAPINGGGAFAADGTGAAPSGLPTITTEDMDGCTDSGVRVTWARDPADWGDGGTGTRSYDLLRDGTPIATGLAYGTTQFEDPDVNPGTTYLYSVQFNNGCSLSDTTIGIAGVDMIGSTPTGLSAITATDLDACGKGILIAWPQDPSNWGDGGTGTRSYDLLRDGTPIATGIAYGTTSYTDSTATAGTTYSYKVRYVNGCSLSAVTHGVGAWSATTMFTTARYRHTSVTHNGYVYVLGGYTGGTSYLDDVQFAQANANGTVGAWTATTSFPTVRSAHTSVVYNGYIYVLGGTNGSLLNDVQYAPINPDGTVGAWTAATSFPAARYSHTSVAYNGYIYVIGGFDGSIFRDDVQFAPINGDGSLGAWTATSSFPTGRYRHTAEVYNGYLYVIAGRSSTTNLNDVQVAPINPDGTVGAWTATTSFNMVRWGHTSAAYDGYMYILGGYSNINTVQYAPINADGTVGSWIYATNFTTGRSQHTTVACNGYLYVMGGNGGSLLRDVQYARINASGTATEADGTPTGLAITSGADKDPNVLDGVIITFSSGSPATQHDLWMDGSQVATAITSPHLYLAGNSDSHTYTVRAINGACYADSNGVVVTDSFVSCTAPALEVTAEAWSPDKATYSWSGIGSDNYRVIRGALADLPDLDTASADGCLKYAGPLTGVDVSGDDPTVPAGGFYWYLVQGYNCADPATTSYMGPAGPGKAGAQRRVTWDGASNCP